jgi:hypothetical protein
VGLILPGMSDRGTAPIAADVLSPSSRETGLAVLGCVGFWFLPVVLALAVLLTAGRRSVYVRYYAAQAASLQLTWLVIALPLAWVSQMSTDSWIPGVCGLAAAVYSIYVVVASVDLLIAAANGRRPRYGRYVHVFR